MPYLIVDIGNTNTKLAHFSDGIIIRRESYANSKLIDFDTWCQDVDSCLISNVSEPHRAAPWLQFLPHVLELNRTLTLPFSTEYPESLGNDRMANAAGARALFPQNEVLCIDIGTCLKFDFINAQGQYLGGAISPGIGMRFKSMNDYTARLPLPHSWSFPRSPIGGSTQESILSGVLYGMLGEIEHMIRFYSGNYKNLRIILSGGDAPFFEGVIKTPIFAEPDLTLIGLHEILKLNVS